MWEIEVLDALQNIHTPWLDKIMVAITSLGNAGNTVDSNGGCVADHSKDEEGRAVHGHRTYP